MGILSIILRNKNFIIGLIIASVIGIGAAYISSLKKSLTVAQAEKITLETQLQVSQSSVKQLQLSLDEQNAAIDKLKLDSDARIKFGQKELNKAKVESELYRRRAEDIMKVKPDPTLSICDAANALINSEISNAK